jgi:hypothetical protein
MAVIDLGEMAPMTGPPAPMPEPTVVAKTRWIRDVKVLALLLLSVGVLAASAAPLRPPMMLAALIPIGAPASVVVIGDRAIVIDGHNGHYEISAYALSRGARMWTAPIAADANSPGLSVTATTLMVTMYDDGAGSVLTQAYDLDSGGVLWSTHAFTGPTLPGGGVLALDTFGGSVANGGGGTHVNLLDQRTGAARWTVTIPGNCQVGYGGEPADIAVGLVELCVPTGELAVRDLDTGLVRARQHVDLFPTAGGALLTQPSVNVVDGLVLVGHDLGSRVGTGPIVNDGPTTEVDAYRASDLARLWTAQQTTDAAYFFPCGTNICQAGDGGGDAVLDPRTGRRIAGMAPPGEPARFFVPVADKPTTLVLVPAEKSPGPLDAEIVPYYVYPVPQGQLAQVPSSTDGLTWVARQTSAGLQPIQQLRGVRADSCLEISAYVVCSMPAHVLAVWHLP